METPTLRRPAGRGQSGPGDDPVSHTHRRRRPRARTLLLALATTTALISAAPAMADNTETAQGSLSKMVAEAQAGGKAVPQEANQPLPHASGQRGLQAVTASNVFFDSAFDSGLAPDLQQMLALTSDEGRYTISTTLDTNALVEGDFVATYVNTDGNASTGSPAFGGADVAVGILGQFGQDVVGGLRWNGSSFQVADFPSLISFASGTTDEVWSMSAADLGVAPGTPTTLWFGSLYSGVHSDYYDFAPEPGLAPFAFTAGALNAPPPPPPPPVPVAPAPVAPTGGTSGAPAGSPLGVRSFSLGKAPGTIKLRLSWVEGTGRVTWYLTLSARVNGRTVKKFARGAGQAGSRTITQTIRLPKSWRGATISARLEVDNQLDIIGRTRRIHY